MEALLLKNDAWAYVSGEKVKPTIVAGNVDSIEAVRLWEIEDKKARSDIILSISPSELKLIKGCNTSMEVWQKLESIYQSKGPARKATLLKQLTLHRINEHDDISDHVRKFFDTVDKLGEMDIDINPDLLTIMLLYSLPPSFENFRCAIESRDTLPTPENLRVKILEENEARKNSAQDNGTNAMVVKKSSAKDKNSNDRNNKGYKSRNEEPFKFKCHRCQKVGHKAIDCKGTKKNKDKDKDVSLYTKHMIDQEALNARDDLYTENWCLDSGSTSHLCKDTKYFNEFTENTNGTLNLASNASTKINAKGSASMKTVLDGKTRNVTLNEALHVPNLRMNLLSVGKITDKGFKVLFEEESAKIINREEKTILKAKRIDGLYYLPEIGHKYESTMKRRTSSEEAHLISIETWHRRMGHLNIKDLVESHRKGNILGIDIKYSNEDLHCETCIRGKMNRIPFPKRSEHNSNLLEIIHSDICGPMRIESNGKAKYFATFIDDYSRWCEVRMLKKKSDLFEAFKEFKAFAENHTGKRIKFLQSDNGKEYRNDTFDKYLKQHGIERRLTVTHTPEQNGIAERKNRTLAEMARCLLIQSGLSPSFWGEAINTANYIRNRCPSSSLNGKTPFEKWNGRIPNVKHLREFGCKTFVLIRGGNRDKFQPRSKEGILVGYSEQSKAFRIWIPNER